ncbi:MAG TPA: IclR family transcriptional regulator [Gaiellaceae bacterium]|nr:IclR family transcriptional regulator [Gaiellaceae bacterium]
MTQALTSPDSATVGYQTRSLTRALAILDAFSTGQQVLTIKELHERLDLPKPTISRLARELARGGYLRNAGRAYELGPKTFELGSLFIRQRRLDDLGQTHLSALAAKTLQTASLALLAGTDMIHVIVAPSPHPIQHVTEVGSRAEAHATGLGKALLAALPEEDVPALLGSKPLTRLTVNTIGDVETLMEELSRIRERGFALNNEETAIGLKCVAVAADLPAVGSAAVSVSGPAADYTDERIPIFVEEVKATVAALEDALGRGRDYPHRLDASTAIRD